MWWIIGIIIYVILGDALISAETESDNNWNEKHIK